MYRSDEIPLQRRPSQSWCSSLRRACRAGIDEATDTHLAKDAMVRGSGASRPWMACARLLAPWTAQSGDAHDPRTAAAPPEAKGFRRFSSWADPASSDWAKNQEKTPTVAGWGFNWWRWALRNTGPKALICANFSRFDNRPCPRRCPRIGFLPGFDSLSLRQSRAYPAQKSYSARRRTPTVFEPPLGHPTLASGSGSGAYRRSGPSRPRRAAAAVAGAAGRAALQLSRAPTSLVSHSARDSAGSAAPSPTAAGPPGSDPDRPWTMRPFLGPGVQQPRVKAHAGR